jgi:hypothetical protein
MWDNEGYLELKIRWDEPVTTINNIYLLEIMPVTFRVYDFEYNKVLDWAENERNKSLNNAPVV